MNASPQSGSSTVALVVGAPIGRTDIPGFCERVRGLVDGGEIDAVVCDVGACVDPDIATVEALARMQLTARRLGGELLFRHPPRELRELIVLVGLDDVVARGEEGPCRTEEWSRGRAWCGEG